MGAEKGCMDDSLLQCIVPSQQDIRTAQKHKLSDISGKHHPQEALWIDNCQQTGKFHSYARAGSMLNDFSSMDIRPCCQKSAGHYDRQHHSLALTYYTYKQT